MKKCVLVTGSSGGIGSAIVRRFSHDNYFVIGLDKNKKKAVNIKNYEFVKVDLQAFVKSEDYKKNITKSIRDLLPDGLENFVVINNAATQILGDIDELNWSDWDTSFSVNTYAPFFLVKEFKSELKAFNGKVINISSIHSKLTKKEFSCYAASKAALESLTRSLAIELSPSGICVNSIAPAAISTEMLLEGFLGATDKLAKLEECHPANIIASPDELANFVNTVASFEGKFLTGSNIPFNGGIESVLHDPSLL